LNLRQVTDPDQAILVGECDGAVRALRLVPNIRGETMVARGNDVGGTIRHHQVSLLIRARQRMAMA
jgi:hypothetical protein